MSRGDLQKGFANGGVDARRAGIVAPASAGGGLRSPALSRKRGYVPAHCTGYRLPERTLEESNAALRRAFAGMRADPEPEAKPRNLRRLLAGSSLAKLGWRDVLPGLELVVVLEDAAIAGKVVAVDVLEITIIPWGRAKILVLGADKVRGLRRAEGLTWAEFRAIAEAQRKAVNT